MVLSTHRIKVVILGLVLSVLTLPGSIRAHSGVVATAVPVEGIIIDGDLSDWPAAARACTLAHVWAARSESDPPTTELDPPSSATDAAAAVLLAYSPLEQALYVGLQVRDDSISLEPFGTPDSNTGIDGCWISLVVTHRTDTQPSHSGRPSFGALGREISFARPMDAAQLAARAHGDRLVYEWRIGMAALGDAADLRAGRVIGLQVVADDRDPDGSYTRLSLAAPERTLDLLLRGDLTAVGRVAGRVRWEDGEPAAYRRFVAIGTDTALTRVTLRTDASGAFEAELPADSYLLTPSGVTDRRIEVPAGGQVDVPPFKLGLPDGTTTALGAGVRQPAAGRTRLAAGGQWRGPWQSFNVGHGLPDPTISDILQDDEGALWLATHGQGVARYDGTTFFNLTTDDGLPYDRITSLAQTSDGALWFGSGDAGGPSRGLCRYDRGELIAYRREDGLPDDRVLSLHVGETGDLWIGCVTGLARLHGGTLTWFDQNQGLPGPYVKALEDDGQGGVWVGTAEGLGHFRADRMLIYDDRILQQVRVSSLLRRRAGSLWIGTRANGVLMLQDGVITRPGGAGPDVPQRVQSLHEDDDGHVWVGTWGRGVMRWDGVSWQTYSTADGLAGRDILSMYSTTDGDLWLGTGFWYRGFWQGGNGLSRFVGRSLATLEDLADVWALAEDSTGAIWIGNMAETRIVREGDVETVPVSDVWGMVADADGMWLNSRRQGLWRYEDGALKDISTARGLPQSGVSVLKDSRGRLWAGWQNDGVSILVGDRVEHLSTSDDSPTGYVGGVAEDRAGNIWIASSNGLSRYDETGFTRYLGRRTSSVLVTGKGHVWAGSFQSGAFHLRPGREAFELLTAADGLGHTSLTHVAQSRDGHLWFSTYGGGVTRYDGTVFQTLLTEDGLPSNAAQGVSQATNGDIWIATDGGATRFRPSPTPPPVEITGAVADRALDVGSGRIRVPVTQTYLAIEFQGSSLKTRPNQLVYLYRMVGHDSDWRQTRARRAVYEDLPVGDYTFQVQAVDRDLDYSELPATLQVQIHPNWGLRALQAGLTAALGAALLAAVWATRRRRERDQAREQLVQELEDELQTARKLQMSLMPESTPSIPGLDVAGRCLPVNHVCGDFFQYFVRNGSLSICMADVTGHAMEAAVPVMMFSGILETEMRLASPLDELFGHLNQTLHHKLDRRTYVCFTMGELQIHQPDTRRLRLANCGCPYPYHYQAANGEVAELQMDAYPLGIRPETEYRIIETRLSSGDCLVFCSDGIIEAGNAQEEIFGFERTEEAIRQGCREDQSAEELIDRLIGAVKAFTGDAPQGDDMTVVVLKVEA